PPPGVQPWQGNVLLREQIGTDSVSAWFSGLVAREAIVLDDSHKPATMARGPKFAGADPQTQALLAPVIGQSPVALGTYQPQFAALWRQITRLQVSEIAGSG